MTQNPFPHTPDAQFINDLVLEDAPRGAVTKYLLHTVTNGMAQPIYVPVIVVRGVEEGPVVGITAAVHGNELNGIPVIQQVVAALDPQTLKGTLVGVPGVNIPSLLQRQRRFVDGTDLNHIMPGRADGTVSQVYAYRVFDRIVRHFDYLFDLHTASNGRVNSYYIRADMDNPRVRDMVERQGAQIVVHNPPGDGTLRGAAADLEIPAITLEVGNPNTFQRDMILSTSLGIMNYLKTLDMHGGALAATKYDTILCERSYWLYADTGGLLTIKPSITQSVVKGDTFATLTNPFGDTIRTYEAPEDGIIIGHSVNPVCQTGGRLIHLGIRKSESGK